MDRQNTATIAAAPADRQRIWVTRAGGRKLLMAAGSIARG